ncbi:MAG: cephalosporin hydroxylase family protein [Acidobacteriota bacterium]|nr:MAG: cephalosporin hydroxylase family protein [Acidobacteriota bacterium]
MAEDPRTRDLGREFIVKTAPYRYSYNFTWMGVPIIQVPQDMIAMQEIIFSVRPELIIETGIAHGGSIIYYASLLELLESAGAAAAGAKVLGIDIDIRPHNRDRIESHPMYERIEMIEGSSIDPEVLARVGRKAAGKQRILVALDSNHTHEHVRKELELYSPFVGKGSYLVVFDTVVEDMPEDAFPDRPWGVGNNPKTAVREFLAASDRFVVDRELESRLLITVAPSGYLKCVMD